MTTSTAITASSFVDSLGINTHIDFDADGYQNLSTVEAAINYLGVKNIRDSGQSAADLSAWLQVAQATGAKFDDYIGETSPAGMQTDLGLAAQLAQEGILNYIEGGNEEDDAYPASLGNTLQITAQVQQQVAALAQQYGLPSIDMSFGSGWTAANNWEGDYPNVGNLAAYVDYANAHTYPQAGQTTASAIQQLNSDALLAAVGRPVITTEIGWNNGTYTQTAIAQYVVQAALDGVADGDTKTYYYGLFNDSSGAYGLMNSDGSPTPAGTALHDLTTLLSDTGAGFTPGSLSFSLDGAVSTDNTLLMQKSDGSDWLALWDETAGTHSVTLNLAASASQILVYDPVTGTSSIASASNTNSITVSLGSDPLLIEIIPSGGLTSGSGSSTSSGGGSTAASGSGSGSTGTSTGSTGTGSGSTGTSSGSTGSPDPVLAAPAAQTVAAGASAAISGVSLSDAWAASQPGTLSATVTASSGSVTMTDANGNPLSGSGTGVIDVSGTLAQINAELETLSYTAAAAGTAAIAVTAWDQGGANTSTSVGVTIASGTSTGTGSGATTGTGSGTSTSNSDPAVTVPASETTPAGSTVAVGGVSLTDAWAAANPGSLALNVTSSGGTVAMQDANGNPLGGSGSDAIHDSGTLAQINAELQTLSYTAGNGNGSVTINVWDQNGAQATGSVDVTIGGTSTSGSGTGTSGAGSASSGVSIAPGNADAVAIVSNTAITASAGDHMIFIGGTGDTLNATGGTETVQAYLGGNTITTGAGNDTIRFAGSGNVVNAGGGSNVLMDSGTNNTIVLPGANQGYDDVLGYMMTNGDTFDLRGLLASTSWNGDPTTLGNFVSVAPSGTGSVVSVDPSGASGGASYVVATLEAAGPVSLSTLLAHSIT